jgi:hypothetical protein
VDREPLAAERKEELLRSEILRGRVGVDPDDLGAITGLAALGLTNLAWRNTCVEDWHAGGRLSDGEMLRINSHTTWLMGKRLDLWLSDSVLDPQGSLAQVESLSSRDVEVLTSGLLEWLADPGRRLPTGVTVAELAGDDLLVYAQDAGTALEDFVALAEEHGVVFALISVAAHGGLACGKWWGHPVWPCTVERFLVALDDPGDEHWGPDGSMRVRLREEPALVRDRPVLRELLLDRPWGLSTEAAG